jgi:hypothetical protein
MLRLMLRTECACLAGHGGGQYRHAAVSAVVAECGMPSDVGLVCLCV